MDQRIENSEPEAVAPNRDVDPRWYQNLVESAPDATVMIDSEGRMMLVNAQTERLFGYPRDYLLGRSIEILIPERYRGRHGAYRNTYFAEPKVREMGAGFELWGRRRDGSEFPVEISLSPLRTESQIYGTASIRDISDRKKAQNQFRALLESAPDAMVIINTRGEIRLVNAQTERLFGYQRADLIGKPVEVLIPERLRALHVGHRNGYFAGPNVREMGAGSELWGRRADGSEFPIEISLSPMESAEGTWATAAVRDISDRKREQDAASRLAAIVESSNDAIMGKDLDGIITSWNLAAEKLYGYGAAEIVGKPVAVLVPAGREAEIEEILTCIRSGKQIQHFETVRVTKSGALIDVSLTISPIRTAGGKLVGASTIGRDISQQKKAELRFRTLLEGAPDAMIIINRAGLIELVNVQAERIFGYSRHEMIGKSVELLIPERLRAKHSGHRAGYFTDPKSRGMGAGLELWGQRKDGSEFPIEISLSPMETVEGVWATAAVRDITERKDVETKLTRYAENLERSNKELEQFAYVASHDLQAPLRGIVGFSELLQREFGGRLEQDANEWLQLIVQSAAHMRALIAGLLEFSRVGQQQTELVTVALDQVLAQVQSQLGALIRDRRVQLSHDPLPLVSGAPLELHQLLQNLIGNAIKFQPGEQPRVHVSAAREGSCWRISIRDWGIGVGSENYQRIFQIFQRLHTAEDFEGTGIGLAICQKIVHHHGGRIWVTAPDSGPGALFCFTLRAAAPEAGTT